MIALAILTKHTPGGLPRTGPTRFPSESGANSYPRQPVMCSVHSLVVSGDVDLHVSIFWGSWLQNLIFGGDLRRAATDFLDFRLGDAVWRCQLGCSGALCALLGGGSSSGDEMLCCDDHTA